MNVRRIVALAAVLLLSIAAAPGGVSLRAVSYDELTDIIRRLRGRVVVVDFWADYCPPCKREFPRLVALHRRHPDGLAALSVSLDDPADADALGRVRRFLEAQGADFPNVILAERPETWQAKLKIDGPPCVFVFDRRGALVRKWTDAVDYDEIGRVIGRLLRE